jgi:hypothetical protein
MERPFKKMERSRSLTDFAGCRMRSRKNIPGIGLEVIDVAVFAVPPALDSAGRG